MQGQFYRLKKKRWLSGLLAGLADKFHCSVGLLRILFVLFSYFHVFVGLLIYLLLSYVLPYKEDWRQGSFGNVRKCKEAEKIK